MAHLRVGGALQIKGPPDLSRLNPQTSLAVGLDVSQGSAKLRVSGNATSPGFLVSYRTMDAWILGTRIKIVVTGLPSLKWPVCSSRFVDSSSLSIFALN